MAIIRFVLSLLRPKQHKAWVKGSFQEIVIDGARYKMWVFEDDVN